MRDMGGWKFFYVLANGQVTDDINRVWIGPNRGEGQHRSCGVVEARDVAEALRIAKERGLL